MSTASLDLPPGRLIILCVDDEQMVLQALRLELRHFFGNDYAIETADHGPAALALLEHLQGEGREVGVIITDYMMPQMRGDTFLAEVWARSPKTQIIVLTAYEAAQDLAEQFRGAPLRCVMLKPWQAAELMFAVSRAVADYSIQGQQEAAAAITSAGAGVCSWDLRTNLVSWNRRHAEILGYAAIPDPITYECWADRVHPEDLPIVQAELSQAIAKQTPFAHQYRVVWPNGTVRWVSGHGHVAPNAQGSPNHMVGILLDVTPSLQTAAPSAAMDAEKVRFLSLLSHELRGPLSGVLSVAELLLTQSNLSQEHRAYVQLIQEGGTYMLELLNTTLDLAKLAVGKLPLSPQPVAIADLLPPLCQLFQPQANLKGVTLRTVLPRHAPHRITADPLRLKQVLHNLITNALKFTTQGSVLLSLKFHLSAQRSELLFVVRDTGTGIAPEFMERLFRPYEQAQPLAGNGTGLGLSICIQLVQLMGGTIWLESRGQVAGQPPPSWRQTWQISDRTDGPGTVAYFTLPTVMEFPIIKSPPTVTVLGDGADASRHLLQRLGYAAPQTPGDRADLLLCHPPLDEATLAIARSAQQQGTVVAVCAEALSELEQSRWATLQPLLLLTFPLEAAAFFQFVAKHLASSRLTLDLSYLYQTRQALGLCLGELLALTLESAENAYTQIEQAIATQNTEGLRYWLHSLHNSVKLFGNQPLGSLCGVLESLARGQNFVPKDNHIASLKAEYRHFRQALVRELARVRDGASDGWQSSENDSATEDGP
jgi:PAS domain S-box-containing protein